MRHFVPLALGLALLWPPPAHADTYQYDAAGRMIRADFADGSAIVYTYDPAGNLITVGPPVGGPDAGPPGGDGPSPTDGGPPGGGDTAAPPGGDTAVPNPGGDGNSTSSPAPPPAGQPDDGCGCGATSAGDGVSFGALLLLGLWRRRRSSRG